MVRAEWISSNLQAPTSLTVDGRMTMKSELSLPYKCSRFFRLQISQPFTWSSSAFLSKGLSCGIELDPHLVHGLEFRLRTFTSCIELARCVYDTEPFALILSLPTQLASGCLWEKHAQGAPDNNSFCLLTSSCPFHLKIKPKDCHEFMLSCCVMFTRKETKCFMYRAIVFIIFSCP